MSIVLCSCGCGKSIESIDKYGRKRNYISGHNRRKYTDKTQYKREWNHRNRIQRYEYKEIRSHEIKESLIKEHGNGCEICQLEYNGYNSCVFDFHHINPEQKKFGVNLHSINRVSLEDIKLESEKCILLCSNCHRLEHQRILFKHKQTVNEEESCAS